MIEKNKVEMLYIYLYIYIYIYKVKKEMKKISFSVTAKHCNFLKIIWYNFPRMYAISSTKSIKGLKV